MTGKDHDHDRAPDEREMTSVFRTDYLHTPDSWVTAVPEDRPPPGSALLVIKRGAHAGSRHSLTKTITCAGRHPDSDIVLNDVTVSRRHAEFRVTDNNDVQIVDVGSLNGTHVNRQAVQSATLSNGDEVQLGKFRLVFLTGGPHTVQ
jgi:hypothetical protein